MLIRKWLFSDLLLFSLEISVVHTLGDFHLSFQPLILSSHELNLTCKHPGCVLCLPGLLSFAPPLTALASDLSIKRHADLAFHGSFKTKHSHAFPSVKWIDIKSENMEKLSFS